MRILALDSGNSRVKWEAREGDALLAEGAAFHGDLSSLDRDLTRLQPERVVGVNVASSEKRQAIEKLAISHGREIRWLEARDCECGVRNLYLDPAKLGADRWAALIAARKHLPEGGIVASCGTAITADCLDAEGNYRGGIIAPGILLMRHALVSNTELDPGEGTFDVLPKNTADGVLSGCLLAAAGAISAFAAAQNMRECILSGGDARLIAPHLPGLRATVAENLVLSGLFMIGAQA